MSTFFFTDGDLIEQINQSILSNQNIFALAQQIVKDTPCRPTVQLCAQVAIMASVVFFSCQLPSDIPRQRKVHRECEGSDRYWNRIDDRLEFIRKTADSSATKVSKWVITSYIFSNSVTDLIY
jgi:hypothetical protein